MAAKVAEDQYRRRLVKIIRSFHAHYVEALDPHIADVAKGLREDAGGPHTAWKRSIDNLEWSFAALRKPVGEAFGEMAKKVNDKNFQAAKTLLGLSPSQTRVSETIAQFRDQNIALVENAGRVYAADVRELLDDPESFGLRPEELKAKLLERGNVSESRAELIARDQTLKLNGQLNKIRQTNAGIARYVWSTSNDERVRESHRELDGQEFSWNDPPLIEGEPLNPGDDFQCRCIALPVIPELDDTDEG